MSECRWASRKLRMPTPNREAKVRRLLSEDAGRLRGTHAISPMVSTVGNIRETPNTVRYIYTPVTTRVRTLSRPDDVPAVTERYSRPEVVRSIRPDNCERSWDAVASYSPRSYGAHRPGAPRLLMSESLAEDVCQWPFLIAESHGIICQRDVVVHPGRYRLERFSARVCVHVPREML